MTTMVVVTVVDMEDMVDTTTADTTIMEATVRDFTFHLGFSTKGY